MNGNYNEQEAFWVGEFGNEYSIRNKSDRLHASNLHLFSMILNRTQGVNRIAEFGCNIGMNLRAIREISPNAELHGVEINTSALAHIADTQPDVIIHHHSILEEINLAADLAFTKGVLIHIHPDNLLVAYDNLYRNSRRYILVAEYYDPNPVSLKYRGYDNKMFKRDFAGELLDKYRDLRLLDYGFCYRRDPNFPHDDISWFLLEKV